MGVTLPLLVSGGTTFDLLENENRIKTHLKTVRLSSTHVDNRCDYLHALSCFTPDTWHSGHKDFLLTDTVLAESFPDMACWPWPPQCAIPTGPEAFIFPLSPTWFMPDAFQGSRALMPHSVLVWSTTTRFHDITTWPLRAMSEGCIMISKHILCCLLVFN